MKSRNQSEITYWITRTMRFVPQRILSGLSFLSIFVFTILITFNVNAKSPDYIKVLPKNVTINWSENVCEQNLLIDRHTKKKIGYQCKTEWKEPDGFSTYLMSSNGTTIYIYGFFPTSILTLDDGYGLILYSDSYVQHIFLEIDKYGHFKHHYSVDGEIILNEDKSKLKYPGILVWLSYELDINKCVADFSSTLGRKLNELNALYLHIPSQIKLKALNSTSFTEENKEMILEEMINETLTGLLPHFDSEENTLSKDDYRERVFVFLATNAPNNKVLKTLVDQYRDYIGKHVLDIYSKTESCI